MDKNNNIPSLEKAVAAMRIKTGSRINYGRTELVHFTTATGERTFWFVTDVKTVRPGWVRFTLADSAARPIGTFEANECGVTTSGHCLRAYFEERAIAV